MKRLLLLPLLMLCACGVVRMSSTEPSSSTESSNESTLSTCTGEPDSSLCSQSFGSCGHVSAIDSCGNSRSVYCGTCPSPNTCAAICIPPETCGPSGTCG
ncbi:hypothetical protein SAMN05443572_112129 [Myxococcus fulvus]|uniref:Lipoprotein n=1 Tax=Myxococcus fulvus TaxID=33 RepID=A0A511TBJ7_MYXFU|nr:hypothetical protein [Myxococcus fulvus]GEN10822.1 hypothetical protein MFU01_58590 [Myxococcus fulvus]SEU37518.1 hypothetical protein SAMN05443572_112129 [Myxococcus fulvus]